MKYINIVNEENNQFQRNFKIINFQKILVISIIALIIFSSFNTNFIFRMPSKVSKFKNNFPEETLNRVNYISGKLFWDNETFQDQEKIRKEIKGYDNIEISFKNKNDFLYRQSPLISLVITIFNQENK